MADLREQLGRVVRNAWVNWALDQPDAKPSWLLPWEELDAGQQEVDMRIGEAVMRIAETMMRDQLDTASAQYEELQRRIEDLRSFEREYRSRLRAYHQQQIDDLDGKDTPHE